MSRSPRVRLLSVAAIASAALVVSSCASTTNDVSQGAGQSSAPVSKTISGFDLPQVLATAPDGKTLYVAQNDGTVVLINAADYSKAGSWNSGVTVPLGIAASPDGSTIYMSNRTAGTVLKKKPETGANLGSWSVGSGTAPAGIALSPDGATMYVPQNASAGTGADKLTVRTASNGTLQKTWDFKKGSRPRAAAVSPDGKQVYVSFEGANRIAVLNAADGSEITSFDLASLGFTTPGYLALSKNGDRLYVVTVNPSGVLVLNTKDGSAIEKWTDGFKSAFGIAAATCGQNVFVSDWTNPGNVQAVDQPNQCVETVTVTGINPNSGPDSGGTQVTVTGSGFVAGAQVSLGGSDCASEAVQSPTQIICKTQAGKAGLVDVTVKNPSGATGTLPQGFTYVSGNLPTAPQAVTALFNNKTDIITVTWQAPANQGGSAIVRYTATATDNNAKTPDLSCTTPNGTTLTCKIQVGNPGPRYNVTVTATNGAGTGPASAPPVDVQTK